jgi:hypothetical protein
MKSYVVSLKSQSPMAQSRFYTPEFPKQSKETADAYEERTWKNRLHIESGKVVITPFMLRNSLNNAAKFLGKQIPGKGKSTYTKHFNAGIFITDSLNTGVSIEDVKRLSLHVPSDGIAGGTKRVIKHFPVVENWSGKVKIIVLDETITKEVLLEHLQQAGLFIGLGAFRPINRGNLGRFEVLSLEEVK